MANLRKRGKRWRAEVYRQGVRDSQSFDTKAEAAVWALQREAEITGRAKPSRTLGDALERYKRDVSPSKAGAKWELLRLGKWQGMLIARRTLCSLSTADLVEWRDARKVAVSESTVNREMTLLRSVLETARREWQWIDVNPMRDVQRLRNPPSRRRRISQDEIDRICLALGYVWPEPPKTTSHRVALMFLLAIETAMRAGEILSLRPETMHLEARYVDLPRTKNGDHRVVPLSSRAVEILKFLPDGFHVDPGTRDALFRRAKESAQIADLHFHDSRAEAIWRLSKKLDVLQLARMIGHRDPKSLMFYFSESPTDTAKRLDESADPPMRQPRTPSSADDRR